MGTGKQVTGTENLVKFGRVFFEICEQSDRHTDTLIAMCRPPTIALISKIKLTKMQKKQYTKDRKYVTLTRARIRKTSHHTALPRDGFTARPFVRPCKPCPWCDIAILACSLSPAPTTPTSSRSALVVRPRPPPAPSPRLSSLPRKPCHWPDYYIWICKN